MLKTTLPSCLLLLCKGESYKKTVLSAVWRTAVVSMVKSAIVCNAVSAFRATGIVPYRSTIIPDAFLSEELLYDDGASKNNTGKEIGRYFQPGCSTC